MPLKSLLSLETFKNIFIFNKSSARLTHQKTVRECTTTMTSTMNKVMKMKILKLLEHHPLIKLILTRPKILHSFKFHKTCPNRCKTKCHRLTGSNHSLRTVRIRKASLRVKMLSNHSCKRKVKDKLGLTGFVHWKTTSF
jgi:hypothetical protein